MTRTLVLLALTLLVPSARSQDGEESLRRKSEGLKKEVTRLRGLDFKRDVDVGVYSKEDLRRFLERELFEKDFTRAKCRKLEKAWSHFRLIPSDMDLRETLTNLIGGSLAGFYDPRTKELKLIASEPALGGADWGMPDMATITLVHELVHAAQDQNFDLFTIPLEEETNGDLVLAVKALPEGEASAVAWQYAFRENFDFMIGSINESYKRPEMSGSPLTMPRFLREGLTFPYGHGCDFVLAVKHAGGGWNAVSRMYDDLPASTEQVLHPEKYWRHRDHPTSITIPQLRNAGERIAYDVHGEFVIRILLMELGIDEQSALVAAEGWDGDRFAVFEKDGKVSSVWFTTWDSEEDAAEFAAAYEGALWFKYGGIDGHSVKIERRGRDVLILDDLQSETDAIWRGVKKEELKKVERFRRRVWTCPDHPEIEKDLNTYCPTCTSRLVKRKKD